MHKEGRRRKEGREEEVLFFFEHGRVVRVLRQECRQKEMTTIRSDSKSGAPKMAATSMPEKVMASSDDHFRFSTKGGYFTFLFEPKPFIGNHQSANALQMVSENSVKEQHLLWWHCKML